MEYTFLQIDLGNKEHGDQLIRLLDFYMQDEMGNASPMSKEMKPVILKGLKNYSGYLGFFALVNGAYAALANCNKNFSSFKAKPLINIHDFVVHPDFRGRGVGKLLLDSIAAYGKEKGYCRINLEVRKDNISARKLYEKAGYDDCHPRMYFWEKEL